MRRTHRVLRNTMILVGTHILCWALSLLTIYFWPHYLGVEGMGKIWYAYSWAGLLNVLVVFGMTTYLTKEVARDEANLDRLLPDVLAIRLGAGALFWGILCIAATRANMDPAAVFAVYLITAAQTIGALNETFAGALQGTFNVKRPAFAQLIERGGITVVSIALLFAGHRVSAVSWGILAGAVFSLITNLTALGRRALPRGWPRPQRVIAILRGGFPYFLGTLFISLYGNIDQILLKHLLGGSAGYEAVGWYGTAKQLMGAFVVLPFAIYTALLPALTRLNVEDPGQFRVLSRRAQGLIIVMAVPLGALLSANPEFITRLLHYRKEFDSIWPIYIIYGLALPLRFLSLLLGAMVIATDRQRILGIATAVATVVNVVLNLVLIPISHRLLSNGAIGAAATDVLTETVLVGFYWYSLRSYRLFGSALGVLLRSTLAALPGALVVHYMVLPSLLLECLVVTVCGGLFFVVAFYLGCITRDDIQILKDALAAKSRGTDNDSSNGHGPDPDGRSRVVPAEATPARESGAAAP